MLYSFLSFSADSQSQQGAGFASGQRCQAGHGWRFRATIPILGQAEGGGGTWKEAYCRMQKGCAVLLVMDCSQNTCSGHCTTALLRMRLSAYTRWLACMHNGCVLRSTM